MLEFYAIVLAIILLVIAPILYVAIPRILRQLKAEETETEAEMKERKRAEAEYAAWLETEAEAAKESKSEPQPEPVPVTTGQTASLPQEGVIGDKR